MGPSDIVSVDSNRDVTGIHNITIDGTFTNGAITFDNVGNFSVNSFLSNSLTLTDDNNLQNVLSSEDLTENRTIKLANSSGTLIPFSNPSTETISVPLIK